MHIVTVAVTAIASHPSGLVTGTVESVPGAVSAQEAVSKPTTESISTEIVVTETFIVIGQQLKLWLILKLYNVKREQSRAHDEDEVCGRNHVPTTLIQDPERHVHGPALQGTFEAARNTVAFE
ncbi:hypothetical protein N7462_000035 [Penicillium macrosclerotiorum]|uniref:uncharacterized protein n=1 Tax=Penicillium macrosclerotiorum TaxID=303699 RepID=UPI0025482B91|nr:uncharacterized protein N7462_000035 [Penicillium macrosclerotiorum]KAJ5698030.1 hypothetical protein N7462_000035 [Penicillium macrosclerotiorum]